MSFLALGIAAASCRSLSLIACIWYSRVFTAVSTAVRSVMAVAGYMLRAMTSSWSSTMRALKEDTRESRQVPASFTSIFSLSLSPVPSFPPLCSSFLSLFFLQIDRNCDSSSLSPIFNFTFKCHGREWGWKRTDFIFRSHMING